MFISSVNNERIKQLKKLKTKKGRDEEGAYLLEGKRAVLDAARNGVRFECLLVQEGLEYDFDEKQVGEIITVSPHIIAALSETSSPEGIIAKAIQNIAEFDAQKLNGFIVMIDHLQDAGNLGTIIRTADAAGAGAVVLSQECVDLFNPKVIRATMGSIFNIPVYIPQSFGNAVREIKECGYTVFASALDGDNFYSLGEINTEKSVVIIGNEGNGITKEILVLADKKVKLPMRGKAESLNAAIAAGILIYGFIFG